MLIYEDHLKMKKIQILVLGTLLSVANIKCQPSPLSTTNNDPAANIVIEGSRDARIADDNGGNILA